MAVIQFYSEDAAVVLADTLSTVEDTLGRTVAPSDPEMLLVNAFAYRMLLRNIQDNATVRQNLVAYSNGAMLDELCAQVGVSRLPAAGAACTLQISLAAGNTGVVLPAGIRVQTTDQQIIFTTDQQVIVNAGETTKTVTATAQTTGSAGNGYVAGKVSVILDPQPFVTAISNTDTTTGGADDETDDQLRARYPLALSSFSVAGPEQAYIYWAKTADATIIDVKPLNAKYKSGDTIPTGKSIGDPIPGTVAICILCKGGVLPSDEIIAEVETICSADKIRPMNDIVTAYAPTKYEYSISVNLILYSGVDETATQQAVTDALTALVNSGLNTLGKDVVVKQIEAVCMIPGKVYKATATAPSSDYVADDDVYTSCTGITVNITGTANG